MEQENITTKEQKNRSEGSFIQFCIDGFEDEEPAEKPQQKKKINNTILTVAISTILLTTGYFLFFNKHFKSLTVEAGCEPLTVADFCKTDVSSKDITALTNLEAIEYNSVGAYEIELLYKNRIENVTLRIKDTTAPKVVFKDVYRDIDYQFDAMDFIESIDDATETVVEIDPVEINEYGRYSVNVKVSDAGGNFVSKQCTLEIFWLKEEYSLQINRELSLAEIVSKEEYIPNINEEEYRNVNIHAVGDYWIHGTKDDIEYLCTVHVVDREPPFLILQNIEREGLDNYKDLTIKSFIVSIEDDSEIVELRALEKIDFSLEGQQTISIMTRDIYGNEIVKTATYTLTPDIYGPQFEGLLDIKTQVNTTINYISGVSAIDKKDGKVNFRFDASSVNVSEPGFYYVNYEAEDSAGNVTKEVRLIEIY